VRTVGGVCARCWPVTGRRRRGRSQHYCGRLDCGLPLVAFWQHNANAKCQRAHACTRSMPCCCCRVVAVTVVTAREVSTRSCFVLTAARRDQHITSSVASCSLRTSHTGCCYVKYVYVLVSVLCDGVIVSQPAAAALSTLDVHSSPVGLCVYGSTSGRMPRAEPRCPKAKSGLGLLGKGGNPLHTICASLGFKAGFKRFVRFRYWKWSVLIFYIVNFLRRCCIIPVDA